MTVNDKVSVSRRELRKFRATLFQIESEGPEGKRWGSSPDVIAAVYGYANFVAMVDPEKGAKFQAQVRRIIEKYGRKQFEYIQRERWVEPTLTTNPIEATDTSSTTTSPTTESTKSSTNVEKDNKKWWKFW